MRGVPIEHNGVPVDHNTLLVKMRILPAYVPYFLGLIKAGCMTWYPTDRVVGTLVCSADIRAHPALSEAEEIWFVFQGHEE